MLIKSTATEFFFKVFANFTKVASSSSTGEATNTVILYLAYEFFLCFNARQAMASPFLKLSFPYNLTPYKQA